MLEPLISIKIHGAHRIFSPGEVIKGEIQIDNVPNDQILAIEQSVMWYTEGKGEEDMGIHDFQRFTVTEKDKTPLGDLRKFETTLPNSPLSYEGYLIKLRWSVRVRVFLVRGREIVEEQSFQLGNIPSYQETQEHLAQQEETSQRWEAESGI